MEITPVTTTPNPFTLTKETITPASNNSDAGAAQPACVGSTPILSDVGCVVNKLA